MPELVVWGTELKQRWRRPIPEGEVIRVGRAPRNGWAVPWDALISREHVEIQLVKSQLQVRRLERARNPVFFHEVDSSEFLVSAGEQFRIGRTLFQFEIDVEHEERVRKSIDAIPALLLEQHVNFRGPSGERVHRELRDPTSPLSIRMAATFRRVIVLETAAGIGPDSRFDMEQFLRVVWERVAQAFELPYDLESFHPEQIAQALKSEEPAAFCILDAQNLSETDLHRLRGLGFTQANHHVLYVGDNPQLGTMSYPTSTPDADDITAIVSSSSISFGPRLSRESADTEASAAKRCNALQEILRLAHRTLSFEDVLARVVPTLFDALPESQLGCIYLFRQGTREVEVLRWDSREVSAGRFPYSQELQFHPQIFESREVLIQKTHPLNAELNVVTPIWDSEDHPLGAIVLFWFGQAPDENEREYLRSVATTIALMVENQRLKAVSLRGAQTIRQLELARSVQQEIFPKSRPSLAGYEFADLQESSDYVGGDFWDYVPLGTDRIVLVVGDVAGKGIPAALMVAQLLATSRSALRSHNGLREAMSVVNREFCESISGHRFATLIFVEINAATETLTWVNAGHLAPLLRHCNGVVERIGLSEAGLPVGIIDDLAYEQTSLPFCQGDTLLVFTDGVTEAVNSQHEIFGQDRVNTLLAQHHDKPSDLLAHFSNDVHSFLGTAPLSDDLCLVACARLADTGM